MATCTTLTGIAKGCSANLGGITAIWIADQEDVASVTEAAGVISAITMEVATYFEGFDFRRNTGNFVEDMAQDLVNGSGFVTATVSLMFHRREATKSQSIQILAEGQRDLALLVKDANDVVWYFPQAQLTAVGEGSGTAKADGSKYSLTFVAENSEFAWETTQTVVDTVLAP